MIKFGLPAQENSYNITGQNIDEKRDPIFNRTIDRTLRSYQKALKADISIDFDYMSEANFALLQKDIRNGTDKNKIFIPHPSDLSIYSFLNKTGNTKGYVENSTNAALPFPAYFELSGTQYGCLEARDAFYFDFIPDTLSQYVHIHCAFDISPYLAAYERYGIKRLMFLVIGNASESAYLASIWNFRTSLWEEMGNSQDEFIPAGDNSAGIWTRAQDNSFVSVNDYIKAVDNIVVYRIRSYETGKTLRINYAALYVNGFNVAQNDPILDLNFRERFSGNGYRGSLNLTEI